jgi:chorismate mutase
MHNRLNELRAQVCVIDREIVASLAQRLPCGASTAADACASTTDDRLQARLRAEYAQQAATIFVIPAPASTAAIREAADRAVLAAIRRRLDIALQIAAAKAAGAMPRVRDLAAAQDPAALEAAITQPDVEEQVIARAADTARALLAAAPLPAAFPETVATLYRDWIIPLARRVQVEELLAQAQGNTHSICRKAG